MWLRWLVEAMTKNRKDGETVKGQTEPKAVFTNNKNVASEMVPPPSAATVSPSDIESLREMQETQVAQQKLDNKKQVELGKVAAMLGATVKVTDWTFPFLHLNDRQLSVSEWYPDLSIVVDKFFHFGQEEEVIVDFKKKAFRAQRVNGKEVRYAYLTPEMELYDLAAQLNLLEGNE